MQKDIAILKKAIVKKYPYDECHAAIERLETLIKDAPKFFSHHDFNGEKLEWLESAGLIE